MAFQHRALNLASSTVDPPPWTRVMPHSGERGFGVGGREVEGFGFIVDEARFRVESLELEGARSRV